MITLLLNDTNFSCYYIVFLSVFKVFCFLFPRIASLPTKEEKNKKIHVLNSDQMIHNVWWLAILLLFKGKVRVSSLSDKT